MNTLENVFDFNNLEPTDGFQIEQVELGGTLSLHLTLHERGQRQPVTVAEHTLVLARWEKATLADRGACQRLRWFLEAAARYLTTGGSMEQMVAVIAKLAGTLVHQVNYPGWHYSGLSSKDVVLVNHGVVAEHVFVSDTSGPRDRDTPVVVWQEGLDIEGMTLGEYIARAELELEEELYQHEGPATAGSAIAGYPRAGVPLQLPDRTHPGSA